MTNQNFQDLLLILPPIDVETSGDREAHFTEYDLLISDTFHAYIDFTVITEYTKADKIDIYKGAGLYPGTRSTELYIREVEIWNKETEDWERLSLRQMESLEDELKKNAIIS